MPINVKLVLIPIVISMLIAGSAFLGAWFTCEVQTGGQLLDNYTCVGIIELGACQFNGKDYISINLSYANS